MYHLHIPLLNVTKMQNELQKVSNEGSQFSDIFEKIQADKAQLSTESKRLNSDTHDTLSKLSGAKWGNHIIGSSEQEASNSMVTAYNKQQGDHPPSSSNTDQHTRKVQRPWNSRQGNNNSRGRPLQRGFKRRENKNQS
ncbi:unnamed protein product [Hymenolepis diminuta]|uniref:DUF948 domain-containing protein n=1 Tax=Hymenolepis diminuta TaxID=6216 RepID=A0A0R3SIN3_HYMDI|nr:unnamed protein product [Hymenolepis diminuta]